MKKQAKFLPQSILTAALLTGQLLCSAPPAMCQQPAPIPTPPNAPSVLPGPATVGEIGKAPVPYYRVTGSDDHLKMVVNTSRILILDHKIPQVQVNNPDILSVVPISPTQVQVSAKRTGVTQVNIWSDDKHIYTVNVIVTGDSAELSQILKELFPRATLTIVPVNGNSAVISGYVEQQDAVPKIVQVASNFFPNVINNMVVSGTQQGVVHVKIIEISRTKMRNMGFDFAQISSNGNVVWSGVNGLLSTASGGAFAAPGGAPDNVFKFNVAGANAFYGVLSALRSDSLAKLLSEPDLVAVSGRPAWVLVGGEIGYQTTSALTGTTVGFKEYGTRLDMVPIVLGNGRMHIDVRASVSQIDAANSVAGIPALKSRSVETGVELRSGQTLAIAGLIEQRVEATNAGYPWVSEVPYLGALFRTVTHSTNEVELLVLLTPEIVDGMEPGQVPTCLPGSDTTSPSDWELFFKGYLEVPNCCSTDGQPCQSCNLNGSSGTPTPAVEPVSKQNPQNRAMSNQVAGNSQPAEPAFIGPIGYDVLK